MSLCTSLNFYSDLTKQFCAQEDVGLMREKRGEKLVSNGKLFLKSSIMDTLKSHIVAQCEGGDCKMNMVGALGVHWDMVRIMVMS